MPRAVPDHPLGGFHPAVADWFTSRFDRPTDAQAEAWPVIAGGGHALIAAPTGSGKTLAAFLSAISDLVVEGLAGRLTDEVRVLYVSPLKALSNDVQKNLEEPLAGVRDKLLEHGVPDVPVRSAVRTGDTPAFERERMRRTPPHILVTTPESLSILLTSDSGRNMLAGVRSVIVDELHAVAGSKRGAHLMLSLERLEALCDKPPVRIGLSATVKPLAEMAKFLVGESHPLPVLPPSRGKEPFDHAGRATEKPSPSRGEAQGGRGHPCAIIDAGHVRERDLGLELPKSPLDAIMSNEVWSELYDRLADLVRAHRTTLIFVNNRRLSERATRHLAERIGAEHVTAHHGSLSKEHRLKAEQRLKAGELKAIVATSSLELGIDIGDIDLVCQMGSPRMISAFLQRVGRAGHAIGKIPKGRLFPLSLDDLVECAAMLDGIRRGELDRIRVPDRPLDVLAQQIVAEVGCREWGLDELHAAFRRAWPYRDLELPAFEQVVQMLADGYSTRRGRRAAYLHYDSVNRRLRARRGARLTAVTNAGVIPDQFDYEVVLAPEDHRIGTIGEDFAFESLPGDIFQLGNHSYRVLKVETSKVIVEDAKGQAPTVPFWFGEAPSRSEELSRAVSRLRRTAGEILDGREQVPSPSRGEGQDGGEGLPRLKEWFLHELDLPEPAASQLAIYLAASKAALSVLPTHETIVFERFFDDVGDTHLVIHSPYGSRINRAWGLALRKRFCRQFNFELQASALEDSIVLSLGPTHSFPLDDVKGYLKSATAREVLVQALLAAPMFPTRWRWNAAIALAVRRMRNGKRTPPPFQRADSEDLLAVIFPDQLACAENIAGDREVPDHPLVKQTVDDCLHETMDVDGFLALLRDIESGAVNVICRDLAGPSPLAHAILGARPYAFLDDGDAEGRRTRAVSTDRNLEPQSAADLGTLDPEAIARVREEARPEVANADELHDALVVHGFLTESEARSVPSPSRGEGQGAGESYLESLMSERRVASIDTQGGTLWVAAERLSELRAALDPASAEHDVALKEIVRSRLELLGPVTEAELAAPMGLAVAEIRNALLGLEAEGGVMRPGGTFLPPDRGEGQDGGPETWCDRRLLLRIHRYTRERRRAEIRPVAPAQFMQFLLRWQRVATENRDDRREGEDGLLAVMQQLEGFEVPAAGWEDDVLAARVRHYLSGQLDRLCSSGRIVWLRRPQAGNGERRAGPVRSTPIMLCERQNLSHWQGISPSPLASEGRDGGDPGEPMLSPRAIRVLETLRAHGASFLGELVHDTGLLRGEVEQALGELVSNGLVHSDSFAGLRALIAPAQRRDRVRRYRRAVSGLDEGGRWSLPRARRVADSPDALAEPGVEHVARVLLRRYGVVFRKLLEREDHLPPWRELFYVYRRLEARGEIRGGRFVSGFSGEQFALPEAAETLRRQPASQDVERVSVSAADPLNLTGSLLPGERVPALSGNRILFENGVPVAVQAGGEIRFLRELDEKSQWVIRNLLVRRHKPGSYLDPPAAAH